MFHNNYGPVLYLYGYIQGQLKTPPDKKLQFLRTRWVFLRKLCTIILKVDCISRAYYTFHKIVLICSL